ncbi:unnamed protein product [Cunninghamella blakesleeana]
MNKYEADEVQPQDITKSISSTSSSSSDSFRRSQMVLASDLTQGLISEVRKLQALLLEKDQTIKEFEVSQADVNNEYILIQKHLKQKDEIEEKLKDENWNLEVTNQDLQERVTDLSQTVSKLNADHTKVLKQLRNTTEQMEISKAQDEKAKSKLEALKAKYDHEQQVLRRNNGNLQRDIEQMKKTINDLNTEIKIQRAKLAIKSTVESNANHHQQQNIKNAPSEASENDNDILESMNENSSEQGVSDFINSTSSSKAQHWALEVGTLKQSLTHAHRSIATLKSHLQKERVEKMEFKKMLADTQEEVEQLQKEIELRSNRTSSSKKKKTSSKSTTSRKRVGLRKKSSKMSLTKSLKSEENIQQLDDTLINEVDQRDINNNAASDSNVTSDEDDDETYSQNESTDDSEGGLEDDRNRLSLGLAGNSLGMELQMGGFIGSSFKPLSSELNDSMAKSLSDELSGSIAKPLSDELNDSITKSKTVDVGINTENDWNIIDENHQVNVLPAIQPISSKNSDMEEQQLHHYHVEAFQELQNNKESTNKSSTFSSTVSTQPDDIIKSNQFVKNGNSIHAENSGQPINDTPIHVSPKTEISVVQQRGKASVMGEYHTSAHSQAPFTIQQQNSDDSSDVNKKLVQDGTTFNIKPSNDTVVFINKYQDQVAESEISCSKTLLTPSDSEINDDKSKECPPSLDESSSLITEAMTTISSSASSNVIKNIPVVHKSLTDVYNNNIHENSNHNVNDKQAYNNSQKEDPITNKPLRENLSKVTNQLENITIELHDEIKTIEKQSSQIKENKQHSTVDKEVEVQNTTKQIDEEYAGQSNQEIKDDLNNEEPIQRAEIIGIVTNNSQDNIIKHDNIRYEDVNHDNIKYDVTKHDEVNQLATNQDEKHGDEKEVNNHDDVKQVVKKENDANKENYKQISVETNDHFKLNEIDHDDIRQDEIKQDEIKQDEISQNEINQNEVNQNGIKNDHVKQKEVKQNIVKQENQDQTEKITMNQEIIQQEITEQEVTRVQNEALSLNIDHQIEEFKTEKESIKQKEIHDHQLSHHEENENSTDIYADEDFIINKSDSDSDFNMISRDEANALIKVAIADALEKERLEAAARRRESEADFISKTEAENMAKIRVENALKKEREKLNKIMQKRQSHIVLKQLKERGSDNKMDGSTGKVTETSDQTSSINPSSSIDQPLSVEQSPPTDQSSSNEQVQVPLPKTKASRLSQDNQSILLNSNLAKRALSHRASVKNLSPKPQPSASISSISSINSQISQPPPPPTRLGLFSGLSKLQPSFSTPSKGSKNVRPSVSSTSLRRATRPKNSIASSTSPAENDSTSPLKKTSSMDAAQHLSPSSAESFGNVRITERSTYTYNRSAKSNQEMISKQPSLQSILSMASSMHDKSHHPLLSSPDEKLQLNGELVYAITQTMIGEWMWKYTRRHVGNGISENKHKRFFWLHPFGRTLYWNTTEPGAESKEIKAKNAFIESVSSIPNHENSDGPPFSLLIKTSKRDIKITATSAERHEIWRLALSFLIVPENYEDTVGNVVNNSVSLSTSKMTPSTVTLLTTTTSTTNDEADQIHGKKESLDLEDAYDSDDSYNVHNTDHPDVSK